MTANYKDNVQKKARWSKTMGGTFFLFKKLENELTRKWKFFEVEDLKRIKSKT